MKKAVITGPTGTIGLALIKKLIKEGIQVLAICRKGSKGILNIPESDLIKIVECDLSNLSTFSTKGKYDVFYHFAWDGTIGNLRNDMYLQNKNVQYTLDAVHLANKLGCKTFIGAGSQAEYGRVQNKLSPNTPTFPETGYGIAKLCAGQMSKKLCDQLGMKNIWVRILSVYGPNDDDNTMVMSTIKKLLNRESPQFTKGEQLWDYLYSDDAANAFYLLGALEVPGHLYCLGSGEVKQLREYIEEIKVAVNNDVELSFGTIPYSNNQVMYLCADISALQNDVNFNPQINFIEGIEKILVNL